MTNDAHKTEYIPKNCFLVKPPFIAFVFSIFFILFSGLSLPLVISDLKKPAINNIDTLKNIAAGAFLLLISYLSVNLMRWKLIVRENTIIVKKLTKEKTYSINEISKVTITERARSNAMTEDLLLFVANKEIARVPIDYVNSIPLFERLKQEGIPFYEGGKPINPIELERRMPRWTRISSRE